VPIDYERLRKFRGYVSWSNVIIGIWNETVRLKSKIRFATKEEATRREKEWREEIEKIRERNRNLFESISKAHWFNQPVDIEFVKSAENRTWLPYFVSEGITFETLYANIDFVLDDAIEELEAKVVKKWYRKIAVMGTYDPNVRNLEIHFYYPYNESWGVIDETIKDIMKYFFKITEYDIKVWSDDTFGISPEKGREGAYDEATCPNDFRILIYDYDYSTIRAISEFTFDINWIDKIEELKDEIKKNLELFRGRKGKQTKLR